MAAMNQIRVKKFTVSKNGDFLKQPYYMMYDVEQGTVFGSRYRSEQAVQRAIDGAIRTAMDLISGAAISQLKGNE